ncbi:hypothetical protein GGH12_005889 [Coemansia sp. RSA 1822]|nr:hypothetical protein GGH12_005889 [Coemansia sp. RSA 1822]
MRVFASLLFASAIGRVASAVQVVTETRVVTATIVKVASDEYQPFCDDEYDLDDSSDESSARVLGREMDEFGVISAKPTESKAAISAFANAPDEPERKRVEPVQVELTEAQGDNDTVAHDELVIPARENRDWMARNVSESDSDVDEDADGIAETGK